MSNAKNRITKINQFILNEEIISTNQKLFLLEIKKDIEQGITNFTNVLKSAELHSMLDIFANEIAIWLQLPKEEIDKKIKDCALNELELKFVVTNILIKLKKEKEEEDDL